MIYLTVIAALAIGALIYALIYEKRQVAVREKEWALERGALLSRIQTPEMAPSLAPAAEPTGETLHVPYDDDAAHDEYMEARVLGEVR